ncbi:MAG TPA: HAD-IA family hydrolase, partial [Terriglobia bacterium]|nr:HAD-IA family hydrolase [Terriglobia bacterium]
LRERETMLAELFPRAQAMPGARRLTDHLARHGVPQGVASSSHRRDFELKMTLHREWFGAFQCIVLGDDPAVGRGKPAPDIFLTAAERMKVSPRNCLVFEDAPSGVEAARAAGMPVIAVPNPAMDPAAFSGASQIVSSLELFDPAVWGLPSFR